MELDMWRAPEDSVKQGIHFARYARGEQLMIFSPGGEPVKENNGGGEMRS
jgi:hypothetical protein